MAPAKQLRHIGGDARQPQLSGRSALIPERRTVPGMLTARDFPVAMPILAAMFWITISMIVLSVITHRS